MQRSSHLVHHRKSARSCAPSPWGDSTYESRDHTSLQGRDRLYRRFRTDGYSVLSRTLVGTRDTPSQRGQYCNVKSTKDTGSCAKKQSWDLGGIDVDINRLYKTPLFGRNTDESWFRLPSQRSASGSSEVKQDNDQAWLEGGHLIRI